MSQVVDELAERGFVDLEEVGRGGFATVHRARQERFDRTVAIKVLAASVDDLAAINRFERECQAIGGLSGHPNIVTLFDAGTVAGTPYLVMEYLPGGSLADLLRADGPMPWRQAIEVGIGLARALDAAHARQVLHRDLKPANVLRSAWGDVAKLGDFGIARIQGAPETKSGVVTASIGYAAPEILSGDPATVAADLYGLGSTVYALLLGHPPFARDADESMLPMLRRIMEDDPPSLSGLGLPAPIGEALVATMAKDPSQRPGSAAELAAALAQAQAQGARSGSPGGAPLDGATSTVAAVPPPPPVPAGSLSPAPVPAPPPPPRPAPVAAPPPWSDPAATPAATAPVPPPTPARSGPPVPLIVGVAAVLVVVLVAGALALRGGGAGDADAAGGGTTEVDPPPTTEPPSGPAPDEVLLRTSDLPGGFAVADIAEGDSSLCDVVIDTSAATDAGRSSFEGAAGLVNVQHEVLRFGRTEDAATAVDAIRNAGRSCDEWSLTDPGGFTTTLQALEQGPLRSASGAEETIHWIITGAVDGLDFPVDGRLDVVRDGPVVSSVLVFQADAPGGEAVDAFALADDLTRLVAERLDAG